MPSGDTCTVCVNGAAWHDRMFRYIDDYDGREAANRFVDQHAFWLMVRVESVNDNGLRYVTYGRGRDTDAAVENAVDKARRQTGDDSYVMNDWSAA